MSPAKPELGAAIIEVTEHEIDLTPVVEPAPEPVPATVPATAPAPIAFVEPEYYEPVELTSTNTSTIDNILEQIGVANNEEENALTETLGTTTDAPAVEMECLVDEEITEHSEVTSEGGGALNVVNSEFEMLASLHDDVESLFKSKGTKARRDFTNGQQE